MVTIPLDKQLDAMENAKKYFDKYNKLKRTYEALSTLIEETKTEIAHLESIAASMDIAQTEDDLVQIKEELVEFGYIINVKKPIKNQKSRVNHFTTFLQTAMIFMSEKITIRMMNLLSNSQPEMTGGFMQKVCPAPMLL